MRIFAPLVVALLAGTLALGATSAVAATPAAAGTTRVLAVRVYWTSPDTVTMSILAKRLTAVSEYFRSASDGRFRMLSTVIPGWLKISGPTSPGTCWPDTASTSSLESQARAAAATGGYNPGSYDRLVLYFPEDGCDAALTPPAWADRPGTVIWLAGHSDVLTLAHQFGHTLGLSHSKTISCRAPDGTPVTLADRASCDLGRDTETLMGRPSGLADLGAAQKDQLGWMTDESASVSLNSSVSLDAYLRLPSGRTYWFEPKQNPGPETGPASTVSPGILISLSDPSFDPGPLRLDLHPETLDEYDDALQPGESYTTPEGFTVRADAGAASGTGTSAAATGTVTAGPRITLTGVPDTADVASEPVSFTVTRSDRTHAATISWQPPLTDGGFEVIGYRLTLFGADSVDVPSVSRAMSADVRGTLMTRLVPGTTYTLRLQAITAVGAGKWAAAQISTPPLRSADGLDLR